MCAINSKGTKPEILVRRYLTKGGCKAAVQFKSASRQTRPFNTKVEVGVECSRLLLAWTSKLQELSTAKNECRVLARKNKLQS